MPRMTGMTRIAGIARMARIARMASMARIAGTVSILYLASHTISKVATAPSISMPQH